MMKRIGWMTVAVLTVGGSALAAQGFPALAKPSAAVPATPPTSFPAPPPQPKADLPRRANVSWNLGVLKVEAGNSSLNSILREISLKTGMKITGGVEEERVFGTYGPGTAAAVINKLLDGTKCNMLLHSDGAMLPLELKLTPLTGGVTPPNPMAMRQEEGEDRPHDDEEGRPAGFSPNMQQPAQPVQVQTPLPSQTLAPLPSETQQPSTPTQVESSGSSNPAGDTPRTPQQIFEQLQKLRQQQTQQK